MHYHHCDFYMFTVSVVKEYHYENKTWGVLYENIAQVRPVDLDDG